MEDGGASGLGRVVFRRFNHDASERGEGAGWDGEEGDVCGAGQRFAGGERKDEKRDQDFHQSD